MRITNKALCNNPIFFYFIILAFIHIDSLQFLRVPSFALSVLKLYSYFVWVLIIFFHFMEIYIRRRGIHLDIEIFLLYRIGITFCLGFFVYDCFRINSILGPLKILAAVLFFSSAFKVDVKRTIFRLYYVLLVLVVANFFSIILFPHGLYVDDNWQNYFLGFKNGHITIIMPLLGLSFIYYNYTRKKLLPIIAILSSTISVFMAMSSTSIIGLFVFFFLVICGSFKQIRKFLLNGRVLAVCIIIVFFLLVVFRTEIPLIIFVAKLFNKNATFSGRVDLWDAAINAIKENPFFGVGDNSYVLYRIFTLWWQELLHSHNEILDVLVRTGFIGLALYLNIIRNSLRNIRDENKNARIVLISLASFWIMMMVESYSNYPFYFLYYILLILPKHLQNDISPMIAYKK